jgi:hypothetical protein
MTKPRYLSHAAASHTRRMSTDRPKRVTRFPKRYVQDGDEPVVATMARTRGTKRKINYQRDDDSDESDKPVAATATPAAADPSLAFLLQDPRSVLTQMNMSVRTACCPCVQFSDRRRQDIINLDTWNNLSQSSQILLATFLPPTAFSDCVSTISPFHPSQDHPPATIFSSACRETTSSHNPELLLPSFFSDPHFLSAAHTFQDHLFSSFLSPRAATALQAWLGDVRSGKGHFPWKDELWEQDHSEPSGAGKEGGKRAKAGYGLYFFLGAHKTKYNDGICGLGLRPSCR